jgi:hypothetical protein
MIMKKQILFILLVLPLFLIAQSKAQDEVNAFIDQWHQDASNADMEAYFEKIDDVGIYIGTDATEVWTKDEFYEWQKPRTADGTAWDFTSIERNIYTGKKSKYVWFDELLSFSAGTLRGSGILIKRKEGWRILHYVLSLPVPNDRFGAVLEAMEDRK